MAIMAHVLGTSMYTTFFYIWFRKRYRIGFNGTCFKNETNMAYILIQRLCLINAVKQQKRNVIFENKKGMKGTYWSFLTSFSQEP